MIRKLFAFGLCSTCDIVTAARPNILFVVADDYGWNDVGFHGNSEILTPAIDKLAFEGVRLDNYYVLPVCTPTRAAFLSGRFPIKTGLQVSTISPAKPYGLYVEYTTLADELRLLGYATHALGKWHLGFCNEAFLPHRRGFDTFRGYGNGAEHYFSHIRDPDRVSFGNFSSGYDYYWTNPSTGVTEIDWAQNRSGPEDNVDPHQGQCYSAHELASKTVQIVENHPSNRPLFIYLAFQSVHSPLEAPQEYVDRYSWMQQSGYTPLSNNRQLYAGMVSALDEAVKNVTLAFKRKDADGAFWANTLLVFTTDNGGVGTGNNWPLRGRKATLWEGGTRAVGFVHGFGLTATGYANLQMMHAVDWLPTLLHVAAGEPDPDTGDRLTGTDGLDVWPSLSKNATSPRRGFVYNIEPLGKGTKNMLNGAVRFGCHKLIKGNPGSGTYDPKPQPKPDVGTIASPLQQEFMLSAAQVSCDHQAECLPSGQLEIQESGPWLFDLCSDPKESINLHGDASVADVQATLEEQLSQYQSEMLPSMYNNYVDDWRANPSLHNESWAPWGCAMLPPNVVPAPTNCAWDKTDTTCSAFQVVDRFVVTGLAALECPQSAEIVRDRGTCAEFARFAGIPWQNGTVEDGSECHWCGGCNPQVIRLLPKHGNTAKLICAWTASQYAGADHAAVLAV